MQDNKDNKDVQSTGIEIHASEMEQHATATEMIRQCESFAELKAVVEKIGEFPGSRRKWDAQFILETIDIIDKAKVDFNNWLASPLDQHHGYSLFNKLTRGYGLRSQAIYIKLYDKH